MKLNKDLAGKIVKNTMNVLGKNINIMNHDGIIIGSGDSSRINTYHEIAARVIEKAEPCIIEKSDINKYQGVKAGINLPIKFNEKIIGVVGITGDVDEVSGYGEIVKNMVELILQQEFLRREMEVETRARETFFQQLLGNSIENEDLLNDRIKLLAINTDIYRVVIVINIESANNKIITKEIGQLYEHWYINKDIDMFMTRGENIVLIKGIKAEEPHIQYEKIMKVAEKLAERFGLLSTPTIGIGPIYRDIEKLYLSYQGAKYALEVGRKVYREIDQNIFCSNRLGYDYFLPFIEPSSIKYYLHHLFDRDIARIFSETDIGKMVEALVRNDLNISQTAKDLFIHRNTLLYRMNKIEKLTGLNPHKAKDLFTLLISYHIYLFNN